ncbi:TRAP transporter large permease subunit [Cupriavidus basilensis]|uniref:TRAP transporter large permease n=1 Tax=Cupriavidus basilensis TaxID=68895 RepID=UPI0023E7D4B8|nr:TRAP transporter large permease subunit [Cupriavidus basilensis]MDF3881448.1 TRAP transporter large permease subunit [Cupriavidus basilensis]
MHVKTIEAPAAYSPTDQTVSTGRADEPPQGSGARIKQVADLLASMVAVPAALLVLAEIAVLLTGVICRFVFHAPIAWSDEVASILFLWLATLGAVLALHRGEHMRMTALTARASRSTAAVIESVGICACLAFLLIAVAPAFDYAAEEQIANMPALEISGLWRAAALPVGIVLMALFSILRLLTEVRWRHFATGAAIVIAIVGAFWLARPVFADLGRWNLLIFFVGVAAGCVFAGIPIAFAFGLGTFGYLALTTGLPLSVVVGRMDEGMSHLILLAIPLFVFLGRLIELTGMANAMIGFLAGLIGHVRGGLSYVLVAGMYLVSGISGSKAADMAALAPGLFPEMKKRGAKDGELVALLAATGAQTETVPPSLVLITIGSVTGVSISALFTGGLLPALLLGLVLCAVVAYRARNEDHGNAVRAPLRQVVRALAIALPALALPFVIRAAVVEGVATATEVSTLGIVYTMIAGTLIYRRFEWREIAPMLVGTATLSGAILLIIGTATAMAWALTQSGFSNSLAAAMSTMPGGVPAFMAVSVVMFVVLGSVLEGIPAIVLFGPLLFPIARQLGIHEVHYTMVVILSMGLGLFAPPLGVGYYSACAIARVNPDAGLRPIIGYLVALLLGTIVIAIFPWLSVGFL